MLKSSRAIVLRVIKYGDSTLIADTYTEECGRRSFAVRIPKTRKAAVRPAVFTPMSVLRIDWNDRAATRLASVRSARPAIVWRSLQFSPPKAAIAMFLAEFLSAALREPEPDARMFGFVVSSLALLDEADGNCANFHIVFLLRLSRFLGLQPNVDSYAAGKYFDMPGGRFTAHRPPSPPFLEPEEAGSLPRLMRLDYDVAARLRVSRAARARILQAVIQYYSVHIPSFPSLKSPEILREVFG